MSDEFDPTLEGDPLDLSSMMPVQAQAPQTRPQLPQPAQQPSGFAQAALAALLPLAAKRGGRPAIAALMQGMQQAQMRAQQTQQSSEQQRFQNERLMAGDERAQAQQVATQQHQQAVLGNQQRTAQANLLKDYAAKVSVAESAEQIAALKETFGYAAQVLGIPTSTVDAIASKASPTPAALIERQVKKVVKDLKPEQLDHFAQHEMELQVPGQGLPIPYSEWSKYVTAGIGKDGKPVISVKKPDVPNTPEEQFYQRYATEKGVKTFGELPTADQALARKQWMQADDRPRVDVSVGGNNPREVAVFNQIAGAYERSPLIRAADRTLVLDNSIKAIRQNPRDAAAQLSLAYSYIQALDTYQSAVREGELQNLSRLASKWQNVLTSVNRMAEGAIVPPEVAKQIAANAQEIVRTINEGRDRKQKEFGSRARVSGVGPMWDQFVAGFAPPVTPAAPAGGASPAATYQDYLNRKQPK